MQSIDMKVYKQFVYETIPHMIKNKKSRHQIEKLQSKLFFTNHFFTKHVFNLKYKSSDADASLFFNLDVAWKIFFILANSNIPLVKQKRKRHKANVLKFNFKVGWSRRQVTNNVKIVKDKKNSIVTGYPTNEQTKTKI